MNDDQTLDIVAGEQSDSGGTLDLFLNNGSGTASRTPGKARRWAQSRREPSMTSWWVISIYRSVFLTKRFFLPIVRRN